MINAEKLKAILDSHEQDPRILCELVGGDPRSFYRGANFNNADLRGADLRGYNLTAATFENAWLDRNTRVDEAYVKVVGLERTTIVIRYTSLSSYNFFLKLGAAFSTEQLGDVIDDVIKALELKLGNLEKFFSENLDDDKSRVVRGRGILRGGVPSLGFLGDDIFSRALAKKFGRLNAKFKFSTNDFGRNVKPQPPVNLSTSDEYTSNLKVKYKLNKKKKWPPINEAASSILRGESKNLEVTLLVSTHKKLVALSSVTKEDVATLAAQLLRLSREPLILKNSIEAIEFEVITS
jgi:hypothetical protein